MKTIAMIFLTLFMAKSCDNATLNDLNNAVIQYAADTRGYHLKIIITNQTATISQGRSPENKAEQIKISDADWKALVNGFAEINLEELPNFKDPTQKRFYDGAAAANLKVRYQDKNYESKDFDHGYPPAEIEKLVTKIVSLAKTAE